MAHRELVEAMIGHGIPKLLILCLLLLPGPWLNDLTSSSFNSAVDNSGYGTLKFLSHRDTMPWIFSAGKAL